MLFILMVLLALTILSNASARGRAGALAIFLLAPGPAGSPFPGSAAKSFAARIGYIPLNIVYTILLAASLRPGPEA
ncbi:hypothetical protein ACSBOB_07090 [Mesorhizobium sp. ASY16-5R]|uniref:hypothetical protein n=1 Tax=Mesorhizobium sp. ASY16-5R TaxID=3445772 RepID=UPI003F9EC6B5